MLNRTKNTLKVKSYFIARSKPRSIKKFRIRFLFNIDISFLMVEYTVMMYDIYLPVNGKTTATAIKYVLMKCENY